MQVIYSNTSSAGNCSVIKSKKGSQIIIDCGLKFDMVNKAISYNLYNAVAILLSHHHKDHTAYLKQFNEIGIPIYLNYETRHSKAVSSLKSDFKVIEYGKQYGVGDFVIKPFPLEHISAVDNKETGKKELVPCDCTGYLIFEKSTKEKLLWITDTQYIHSQFPPVEYICVECNYFKVDDYAKEIEHLNSTFVESRRMFSHLSFKDCVDFVNHQDLSKCKQIRLLHLSSSMEQAQKLSLVDKFKEKLKNKDIEVVV